VNIRTHLRAGRRPQRARAGAVTAALAGLALAGSAIGAPPAFAAGPPHAAGAPAKSAAAPGGTDPAAAANSAANSAAKLPAQLNASARAKATGKPVVVSSLTSDTLQVTAEPNGTFTMTSSQKPVRVERDGVWLPIDATLARNGDGTYSPKAAALPMAFSGGGTAALVTITDPNSPAGKPATVSMSWPAALPAPVVSGDTAVYRGVFPGVDLRLAATGDSYSEVLVVHDAAAAANPALASLHMAMTATGLSLRPGKGGAFAAVDPQGKTVFTYAAPTMWDSSDGRTGPAPTADDPGSATVRTLGTAFSPARTPATATARATDPAKAATTETVTLTPPAGALTRTGNTYPLYIDPGPTWGQNLWVTVDSQGSEWTNTSYSGAVEVGDCSWTGTDPCDINAVFRSYFEMNTTPLDGSSSNSTHATVTGASFTITQVWNGEAGCTATPVDLYLAGAISSSTNWPGPQNSYINQASSGAGNGCAAASVDINALSVMQTAAANWWSTATLELRAADETTYNQWKQFDDNPLLSVTYAYPPNAAVNLDVAGVSCNSLFYVNTTTPALTATATDNNDPKLNLNMTFDINGHSGTVNNTPSGDIASWQTPSGVLSANNAYTYTVAVSNGRLPAPTVSTSGSFTVLSQPPTKPTITSADYPPDYWGSPSATGGQFTVSSPDPNLQGFIYTLTGAGSEKAADATTCDTSRVSHLTSGQLTDGFVPVTSGGNAAIAIPPGLSVGYHTLNVQALNYANMPSPESSTYQFYVAADFTHPSANLALSKAVTVSSTVSSSWPAANLTDGNYQATSTDRGWSSAGNTSAANTEWATVDLGSAQSVNDVDLYPRDDTAATGVGFPTAFTIATSTDDSTWTTQATEADYPAPGDSPQRFSFPPTTARYLKVTATSLTDDPYGNYYLQLKQIAAYNSVSPGRYPAADTPQVVPAAVGANGDAPFPMIQSGVYNGLSDGSQLYFVGADQGDVYTMTFTPPAAGYYALGADMDQAANYGQVSYSIDGTALTANGTASFDGYRSSCCQTQYVALGGAYLTAKPHTVSMTMTGKNAASTSYNAAVDYITVAPVSGPTFANFSAAMNNNGIAADNAATSGALDLTTSESNLSQNALSAAGLSTTGAVSLNGYAFTLTAPNTAGNDNVIALGQTIDGAVPSTPASSIAMLAGATCGTVSGGYVTINYTDGTDQQDPLGTVPDWAATPPTGSTPAVTMTYYDKGTSATPTTRNTYLYSVILPTTISKTIASVTLPSFTTSMIPGSCSNALHVLAFGTQPAATTTVGSTAANWVGTWAAPADTTTGSTASPAFANKTLREVIRPTFQGTGTGAQIRVRLTNTQAASAVTFTAVTLAAQATGTGPATVATPVTLKFDGATGVTLPPGSELYSDPITLPASSGGSGNFVVSMFIPGTAAIAPQHTSPSNDTAGPATFVASGNDTADTAGSGTTWTSSTNNWYYLEDADVTSVDTTGPSEQGTVVVLGDQTSLGTGANGHTWSDDLPAALTATSGVADTTPGGIVDLSTTGATTADALAGLAGTVEDEPNVRSVFIDLGTNDLSSGTGYKTYETQLTSLISALKAITFNGSTIQIYVTTIVPDTTTAFTSTQELNREAANNDITNPSFWGYTGYVDFDNAVTGCGTGNSGTPDTTEASLLTSGVPNATYYGDLAAAAVVPVTLSGGIGPLVRPAR
jgi:F5/8 type C domain